MAILFEGHDASAQGDSDGADRPSQEAAEQDRTRVERFPALALSEAAGAIELAPGFTVELVASEPMVNSPVAMQFDARGGLWVVEMVDYSEQETEALGRVSRLEDRDGDGRMDHSQVVADRLSWPTAIACLEQRVWIATPPSIVEVDTSKLAELGRGSSAATPGSLSSVLVGLGRQNVQGMANPFDGDWMVGCIYPPVPTVGRFQRRRHLRCGSVRIR